MGYEGPDTRDPNEVLHDTLVVFTEAIGNSLDDMCSYGLTIGEAYVPFDPDPEDECDEDEAVCSQAWVRVVNVGIVNQEDDYESRDGYSSELSIDLEVGVLRCVNMPDGGEAPTASDMLMAATQAMTDMRAMYCAAMDTEIWDSLISGQWTPMGPLGMQYGGVWMFTAVGPCAPPLDAPED